MNPKPALKKPARREPGRPTPKQPPRPLIAAALLGLLCLPWVALGWAPPEARLHQSFRIFYLHLPLAWWGLFSLGVACVSGLTWLSRGRGADRAEAAVETGLLFMGLALLTGMIWARQSWGVWWRWEPKLFTALLLCLMYAAALLVWKTPRPLEREKKLGAALNIIAFVNVPFIFLSAAAFNRGAHPPLLVLNGALAREMLPPLLAALLIFGVLWLCLTRIRSSQIARRNRRRNRPPQCPEQAEEAMREAMQGAREHD